MAPHPNIRNKSQEVHSYIRNWMQNHPGGVPQYHLRVLWGRCKYPFHLQQIIIPAAEVPGSQWFCPKWGLNIPQYAPIYRGTKWDHLTTLQSAIPNSRWPSVFHSFNLGAWGCTSIFKWTYNWGLHETNAGVNPKLISYTH